MRASSLQTRVAAWLLTLPSPIDAVDLRAAQREACRQCDPNMSEEEFLEALGRLGFVIRQLSRSRFVIQASGTTADRRLPPSLHAA